MAKEMTFMVAMRDFFGMKPEQSLQQFALECRALDDKDKVFFTSELTRVGYGIVPSSTSVTA